MPEREDLDHEIAAGWRLFDTGREDEAIEHFRRLAEQYPADPRAHFEFGGSLDAAGHEAGAIPEYRQAIELGLAGDDMPRVLLQLGSSLRNVGEHEEAVRVLSEGGERFPGHAPLRFFLSLALHDAGRHQKAISEALGLAFSRPDSDEMADYGRVMRRYLDALKEK